MTVLVSLSSRKGMSPPVTRQVYSPEADREASPTFIRLNILRENVLSFFFFKVPSEISHLYLFLVIKDCTYTLILNNFLQNIAAYLQATGGVRGDVVALRQEVINLSGTDKT